MPGVGLVSISGGQKPAVRIQANPMALSRYGLGLEDLRAAIVATNVNAAGVNERADVAKLNAGLQQELAGKGLIFNQPTTAPFRDKLRSAGFYAEWKGKYGEQAWSLLEKAVGKLS